MKKMKEDGRGVKASSGGSRGRGRGWKIQERDEAIVCWLGRHRLATAEQVMRRFGMHRAKAYSRLGVLAEAGLVRFEPGFRSKRVYLATRAGLTHAGLRLSPATVAAASFVHDLATVEAAIELEQRFDGSVVSEREMRASSRCGDYKLLEPASHAVMWPDLVVEATERYAVEVELTLKARDRLRSKMLAYAASTYASVVYLVDSRAVETAVREAGREAGLGSRLRVDAIVRGHSGTPGPVVAAPASGFVGEVRALELKLARALAEVDTRGKDIERRDAYTRLIVNEVLEYLDAGRQQRSEIVRRWEREFASLRTPARARPRS